MELIIVSLLATLLIFLLITFVEIKISIKKSTRFEPYDIVRFDFDKMKERIIEKHSNEFCKEDTFVYVGEIPELGGGKYCFIAKQDWSKSFITEIKFLTEVDEEEVA